MLVSVVITCYNHGRYLAQAIQSVLDQHFHEAEIIVVDDGSRDNTREVAEGFPVKYVYQANAGLSAARNTGIDASEGDFLVFLDADDWLLANALATNVQYLQKNPALAFVSGSHVKCIEAKGGILEEKIVRLPVSDYTEFLKGNRVAMHAAVMYRRWAFNEIRFDTTLKACEDYDVYLQLSKQFPVAHHETPLAAYRIHANNMSGDYMLMLKAALQVLHRQKAFLQSTEQQNAFDEGVKYWTRSYTGPAYISMLNRLRNNMPVKASDEQMLFSLNKMFYIRYWFTKLLKRV